MPRDHMGAVELDRIDLRRLARQIQRAEDPRSPWIGEQPVWTVAPYVPAALAERRALRQIAAGCYRVGPYPFEYIWIAANELPLEKALIPFLVVRSGKALEAFVLWVADHRPVDWVLDVVQYTAMSTAVRNELLEKFRRSEDPETRARQRDIARKMLELNPDLIEERLQPSEDPEVRARQRDIAAKMLELNPDLQTEIRLGEARSLLRTLLAQRGLELGAELGARLDACQDLATLERWFRAAVTAPSAADALR